MRLACAHAHVDAITPRSKRDEKGCTRRTDIYIYINTMAECRSGRKCIAVNEIYWIFHGYLLDDVKYHLPT